MAIKDVAAGRSDLYRVNPAVIQIKAGWNSRDAADPANTAHIQELKASIKEVGVKKPLVCYMDQDIVYVTDGHCRLIAVMELVAEGVEIKTVPVMVEDRHANEADRIFSQIVHNQGKPLTALEQGKVFKRLIDLGWLGKDIAAKAGISASRVSQLLDLLTLPPVLQAFIIEGKASASMVIACLKKNNGDVALTVIELNAALDNAKEAGREKALPKDTEPKEPKDRKPNSLKIIATIIEEAAAEGDIDDEGEEVIIKISEDNYRIMLDLLNI